MRFDPTEIFHLPESHINLGGPTGEVANWRSGNPELASVIVRVDFTINSQNCQSIVREPHTKEK